MWTETTVINPSAWSDSVEADLRSGLGPEVDDGVFAAACASAVERLGRADGPQVVTLNGDGTATVTPIEGLAEAHAANEERHAEYARQLENEVAD